MADRRAPTEEELARVQQAIGDASDDWVQAHEGDVPFEPPDDDASDYAVHAPLVSQTPAQSDSYWQAVEDAAKAAER